MAFRTRQYSESPGKPSLHGLRRLLLFTRVALRNHTRPIAVLGVVSGRLAVLRQSWGKVPKGHLVLPNTSVLGIFCEPSPSCFFGWEPVGVGITERVVAHGIPEILIFHNVLNLPFFSSRGRQWNLWRPFDSSRIPSQGTSSSSRLTCGSFGCGSKNGIPKMAPWQMDTKTETYATPGLEC